MSRILVVDDTEANRDLIVGLVRHLGHDPLEAGNGADALRLIREHRPALVISDILMPVMDGYDLVREIRADPELAHTEVIFYTAFYRERVARELAEACGVRRILIKPAEPQDILTVIEEALAGETPAEPPPLVEGFDREHLRLVTDKLSEKVSELQASKQKLTTLTGISLELASQNASGALIDAVCRGSRRLIGASHSLVVVRRDETDLFVTSGFDPAIAAELETPELGAGVFAEVLAHRKTLRLANPGESSVKLGLPANHPPANAALIAPIASLETVPGRA
jgi:CheY-like chemotaxis protein